MAGGFSLDNSPTQNLLTVVTIRSYIRPVVLFGQDVTGECGLLPRTEPMAGKSEHTVHYTAKQIESHRRRGEGQTDWAMSHAEAMRRRHADPEAPRPYPSWEETITVELPGPKEQITLRLDRDMLKWFRAKGRGDQTLINAVLRGYYEHERSHSDGHEAP